MKKIQRETAKDSSLMRIARYVTEGWPKRRDSIPADVKQYRSYKEELTVRNGLIFKSERLIIPISMRKKDVKQLHQAHMGRARATKFWHQINQKVERIVKTCNPYGPYPEQVSDWLVWVPKKMSPKTKKLNCWN